MTGSKEADIEDVGDEISDASERWNVPESVIAAIYETELIIDRRDLGDYAFEFLFVPPACANIVISEEDLCRLRSVGPAQMQIRRAMRVDDEVQKALGKKVWNSSEFGVASRLFSNEKSIYYVAAYMDLLRSQPEHAGGSDWGTIYSQPTGEGEYNQNPLFLAQFEASRRYYGYLDR